MTQTRRPDSGACMALLMTLILTSAQAAGQAPPGPSVCPTPATGAIKTADEAAPITWPYVITSDPMGAVVYCQGNPLGATPVDGQITVNKCRFTLVKAGYETLKAEETFNTPGVRRLHYEMKPLAKAERYRQEVAEPYVADLIGILRETNSPDAFVVALDLLVEEKPDHRQVVPVIIRNAERLGIYGRQPSKEKPDWAEETTAAIRKLSRSKDSAEDRKPERPMPEARTEPKTATDPNYRMEPPDVLGLSATGTVDPALLQQLNGERPVRPDGTIQFGTYGSVSVTGLTCAEAEAAIRKHFAPQCRERQLRLSVEVRGFNSKVYYILQSSSGFGEMVFRMPLTGEVKVAEALEQVGFQGKPDVRVWVMRPGKAQSEKLPVDWPAVLADRRHRTNHVLQAGDRVFVEKCQACTLPPR
jgi:protein involved in polysaccharide export with SLBB domain